VGNVTKWNYDCRRVQNQVLRPEPVAMAWVYKSWISGRPGDKMLFGARYLWVLGMELTLSHISYAYKSELAARFFGTLVEIQLYRISFISLYGAENVSYGSHSTLVICYVRYITMK
jgi:hypothetical protein